jgi:DNA repair exonuclease SbcCD ATPase subunit
MGYKHLNLPQGNENFPEGLILISGKNSYGKSTILEGLLYVFFGPKIFRGRNASSFITYGEPKAEITVYFSVDNNDYYLVRKWSRAGSSTTKLFEFNKKKEVFQEIRSFDLDKFFEISPEQAMSTVFVRQGEVEELANKKGADMRELIIDLFRLDIIEDALSSLDIESKTKKHRKETLERSKVPIERIQEDIERVEHDIAEFMKDITEKKKNLQEYNQKINSYPSNELISKFEDLYTQKTIIENKFISYEKDFKNKLINRKLNIEDYKSIDKISSIINSSIRNKSEIEKKKTELDKKRQATFKGLGKTKGRIEDIKKRISEMEDSLKTIHEEDKQVMKCPICQNELTKEHYDEIIKQFEKESQVNQKKIEAISVIMENLDKEINQTQKELEKVNGIIIINQELKDDFVNYQRSHSELTKIEENLTSFLRSNKSKFKDTSSEGVKKISLKKERLYSELKAIQNEIKEKQNYIKLTQDQIKDLKNEIQRMHDLKKQIGDLEIDIDHINKAKELVRRFVTEYMVVKRLVKNIALTTNKYIKDFTSGQYSDLVLDLTGTKKTGLSLRIKDNFNNVHEPIEALSGGDRTALGMALRLSISELMGNIRPTKESPKKNPKINFLLLDEPIAALDETRRERILKYLIKSKTFSQIFLITHTLIPPDIQTHKIIVNKDTSTGISHARFEKRSINILY